MSTEVLTPPGRHYGGVSAEQRREERRERLIQAGITLFGTAGYASVSITAICAEADLTKRYFYESFQGAEDFLIAVYQQINERVQNAVLAAVGDASGDLTTTAQAAAHAFFAAIASDKPAARIMLTEILGVSEAVDRAYRDQIDVWVDLLAAILGDHNYHGLRNDLVASALWGLVTGTALRWYLSGWREDTADIATVVATMLADLTVPMR